MTEGEGRPATIDGAAATRQTVAREFASKSRYTQPALAKTVTTFLRNEIRADRNSENL